MTEYCTGMSLVGGAMGWREGNPTSAYWDKLLFNIWSLLSEIIKMVVLSSDDLSLLLVVVVYLDIQLLLSLEKDVIGSWVYWILSYTGI